MAYITDIEIRNALVSRAERYCATAGASLSAIGIAAINDSKILPRIKSGENFTLRTYREIMAYLDKAEADHAASSQTEVAE